VKENTMKTIVTVFLAMATLTAVGAQKIEVMPELAGQVNAQTASNAIPWYAQGEYDALVTAQLDKLVPLVRMRQGDYDYTLYLVRFHSVNVVEGDLQEKELTFYLERQFPIPESGIKFKELWPFQKGSIRVFKVKKTGAKLQIISMEMELQLPAGGERKPAP
jgi:hypothetical protein